LSLLDSSKAQNCALGQARLPDHPSLYVIEQLEHVGEIQWLGDVVPLFVQHLGEQAQQSVRQVEQSGNQVDTVERSQQRKAGFVVFGIRRLSCATARSSA
jgi:hypothetical protein